MSAIKPIWINLCNKQVVLIHRQLGTMTNLQPHSLLGPDTADPLFLSRNAKAQTFVLVLHYPPMKPVNFMFLKKLFYSFLGFSP